jgi:predicted nucleic acid-binding protein
MPWVALPARRWGPRPYPCRYPLPTPRPSLVSDRNHPSIDEWRGRRAAMAVGLRVTGSLGLLGRAKRVGLIPTVRPWIEKLTTSGVYYHPELLQRFFLSAMGE